MSMDGTKSVMVIDPLNVENKEEQGAVELSKGPKDLTKSQLENYAERTGVSVLKLKDLQKKAIMGELVQRLGAARVGSSMLVESEEMIKDGISECKKMIEDYAHMPELSAGLVKAQLGFVDLWVKAAQAHIKSRKDAGLDDSERKPQNNPPPPLVPVQINIQGNQVSEPKETK